VDIGGRIYLLQRVLLVAVIVGSAVAIRSGSIDGVGTPKVSVILAGVVLLAVLALARVGIVGRAWLPRGPFVLAVLAFAAIVLLSALLAESRLVALGGPYRRYTGAVMYLAYAGLFLAVLTTIGRQHVRLVAGALLTGGALVAVYAVLQWAGLDWMAWGETPGVSATLGNTNFVSGYVAIAVPLAVWGTRWSGWSVPLRVAAGATGAVALLALVAASSVQGFLAAAVGGAVLAAVWLAGRERRVMLAGYAGIGLAGLAGLAAFITGLAGSGPLAALATQPGVVMRRQYWSIATSMTGDRPLLGVGIGHYGSYFRAYRTPDAVGDASLTLEADAAHNVPLQMFAEGGVLLGLAYLAVIVLVAVAVFRGARQLEGRELLLLGGLGGAWAAYHVQALVSIDVPALATAHWVLAGAVVVAAGESRFRKVELPWALPARPRRRDHEQMSTRAMVATPVALVVGAFGVTLAVSPMIADRAAGEARAAAQRDVRAAMESFDRSQRYAPWQPWYHVVEGNAVAGRRPDVALAAWERAAQMDPRGLSQLVSAARAAERLDEQDRARYWYERAVEVEPTHPALALEVARFGRQIDDPELVAEMAARALEADPDNGEARELLAMVDGTGG
jgi:putative inorganic carbon (hco3(-)) transporter